MFVNTATAVRQMDVVMVILSAAPSKSRLVQIKPKSTCSVKFFLIYDCKVFRINFCLFLEILSKKMTMGCLKTFEWQCTFHNGQDLFFF